MGKCVPRQRDAFRHVIAVLRHVSGALAGKQQSLARRNAAIVGLVKAHIVLFHDGLVIGKQHCIAPFTHNRVAAFLQLGLIPIVRLDFWAIETLDRSMGNQDDENEETRPANNRNGSDEEEEEDEDEEEDDD